MNLKNNFSEEDRSLFSDIWECSYCGQNTNDSLHHICGRGSSSDEESSPLNASPICNAKCHIPHHGELRTKKWVKILLAKTFKHLTKIGYNLTEKDQRFLIKYKSMYE